MPSQAVVEIDDELQPFSLYIDLAPNTKADLEVVAEASLAFVRALRAAARELAPDQVLRIELVSGTEGSLSLNSIIKFVHGNLRVDKATARALAIAAAGWFLAQGGQWVFGKSADFMMEMVTGPKEAPVPITNGLSKDEIEKIATELTKLQRSPEVQRNVGQIYRSLDRDVSIRGVGLRLDDLRIPPLVIVPRSEFNSRVTDAREIQAVESHRNRVVTETVKLVTAVLDPKSRRKWVIETSEGTRSALMKDGMFIKLLDEGKITTRLSANMKLEVELLFSEKKTGDQWKIADTTIVRVKRIILPTSNEVLASPPRR